MDLMAYWRWDNYVRDLDEGAGFNFNSNQSRLHSSIEIGERLWLVTGRRMKGGIRYALVAHLTVAAKTFNSPDYKYGKFRLWGDFSKSRYFSVDNQDITQLLLQLQFHPENVIASREVIGQSLQTMRNVSTGDSQLLQAWEKDLKSEPRAYRIAEESALEQAFERGEDALRETITTFHTGVSEDRRLEIQNSYRRNRTLVRELHVLYRGRCQLCGFDPQLLYQVNACCGHHVVYLSRGGADLLTNMMLICPNHHEVIHAANAVFDFSDLHYVFANGRREPLVLNQHFTRR
jgi:hypothetical protein